MFEIIPSTPDQLGSFYKTAQNKFDNLNEEAKQELFDDIMLDVIQMNEFYAAAILAKFIKNDQLKRFFISSKNYIQYSIKFKDYIINTENLKQDVEKFLNENSQYFE